MKLRALFAVLAGVLSIAAASDPAERLPDPRQEAQARQIFQDIRCLVCQNESIDDSDAELARDLRQIVREQVRAGRDEAQIKRFLIDRYGEFVLLRPSMSLGNMALWAGPFLVVLLGAALMLRRLRNRTPEPELSAAEAERLKRIASDEPA